LVQNVRGSEAGVKAEGDGPGEFPGLLESVLEKQVHSLGRGGIAVPEGGMDESSSETFGIELAVGGKVSGQRGVDGLLVIPVVDGARLLTVGLDGKAVDVDYSQADSAASHALMAQDRLVEEPAKFFEVVAVGKERDKPGGGWLRGKALVHHPAPRLVPYGGLECGVVGKTVGIILAGESQSEGVEPFPKESDHRVANKSPVTIIHKPGGKCSGQVQEMVCLAEEENAAIGGDTRGFGAKLHRTVERKIEKLAFTH
jgi:hypothetical protein